MTYNDPRAYRAYQRVDRTVVRSPLNGSAGPQGLHVRLLEGQAACPIEITSSQETGATAQVGLELRLYTDPRSLGGTKLVGLEVIDAPSQEVLGRYGWFPADAVNEVEVNS